MPHLLTHPRKALWDFRTKLAKAQGERSITATITTTAVDRDGDVVLPRGMDCSDFRKNPVMLLAHDAKSRLPIGKWSNIERTTNGVTATGTFAPRPPEHPQQAEWLPDTVLWLVQQEMLKAVSIGFIPDDARPATQKDMEQFGPSVRQIITRWKLHEVSIVPIPSNQDALISAVSKGYKTMLSDLWKLPSAKDLTQELSSIMVLHRRARCALA